MWGSLLALPSLGYGAVVKGRNFLYDRGWLKSYEPPIPVVSIGNVEVGGTGKTPLTLHLAKELSQHRRVAIVTRGYRGAAEHAPPQRVELNCPTHICGDEAALLARRLPQVMVIVGKDRVAALKLAAQEGAQVAVLDDGMQHRRLRRTFEIAVVGEDPLRQHYLPWGRLRDDPKRLKGVDLVVTQGKLPAWIEAPAIQVKLVPLSLEGDVGQRVGLFCGIARPERFVATVKEMGLEVVATCFARDHRKIPASRLERFAREAQKKGADSLICTEKDAVKGLPETILPIGWVKSSLNIETHHQAWQRLIERICEHSL